MHRLKGSARMRRPGLPDPRQFWKAGSGSGECVREATAAEVSYVAVDNREFLRGPVGFFGHAYQSRRKLSAVCPCNFSIVSTSPTIMTVSYTHLTLPTILRV